jgi:multidrug resistance efflux pump
MAAVAAVLLGLWWHLDYQSRSKILQTTNGATIQAHSVIVAPRVGG